MKILIFIFISLLLNQKLSAQDSFTQVWTLLSVQGDFTESKKIGAYLELQPRHSDENQEIFETLLRPAFYYRTNKLGIFFLGYLQRFNPDFKQNEFRYWLQWSNSYNWDEFNLLLRLRMEERDLNLSDNSFRSRVLFRANYKAFSVFNSNPFAFIEIFDNLNSVDSQIRSGFQQSRTVIGLTRNFNQKIDFDIGYLKNYISIPRANNQDNNALFLAIGYKF